MCLNDDPSGDTPVWDLVYLPGRANLAKVRDAKERVLVLFDHRDGNGIGPKRSVRTRQPHCRSLVMRLLRWKDADPSSALNIPRSDNYFGPHLGGGGNGTRHRIR